MLQAGDVTIVVILGSERVACLQKIRVGNRTLRKGRGTALAGGRRGSIRFPIITGIVGCTIPDAPHDMNERAMHTRTVFFVSDGTGITAETFGHAVLNQFEMEVRHVRLPFTDTVDRAHQVVRQINHVADLEGVKPLVFTTLANAEVLEVIENGCKGMLMDMFSTFVRPLEIELGLKSNHRIGRFSDVSKSKAYTARIAAIDFSLAHDDGQSHRDLEGADVILVGVSRSGKTPTSLYLAMQYGMKAANYPLIPEDFDRRQLPLALMPHKKKIFGLSILPERLAEIRNERRPDSKYASLINCRHEIAEAEAMMRRAGIRWLSTTTKSIEEIATTILQELQPGRLTY